MMRDLIHHKMVARITYIIYTTYYVHVRPQNDIKEKVFLAFLCHVIFQFNALLTIMKIIIYDFAF